MAEAGTGRTLSSLSEDSRVSPFTQAYNGEHSNL